MAFGNPAPTGRLKFGSPVRCLDGAFGALQDLVVNPEDNRVTHLVVEPRHVAGGSRLVPIERARCGSSDISILCTVEEATVLPRVQEVQYLRPGELPVEDADSDIGVQDVYLMPYHEAGAFVDLMPDPDPDVVMSYDRVPKGMVEIRHLSPVTTSDGHELGLLEGVCVEVGRITHLILRRRHLWRRHELTIPVGDVARMSMDEVTLRLSKAQLERLAGS